MSYCNESFVLAVSFGTEIDLFFLQECDLPVGVRFTRFVTLSNFSPVRFLAWKDPKHLIALGESLTIWETGDPYTSSGCEDAHLLSWTRSYSTFLPEVAISGKISEDGRLLAVVFESSIRICRLEVLFPFLESHTRHTLLGTSEYYKSLRPLLLFYKLKLPAITNMKKVSLLWNPLCSSKELHCNSLIVKYLTDDEHQVLWILKERLDHNEMLYILWYSMSEPRDGDSWVWVPALENLPLKIMEKHLLFTPGPPQKLLSITNDGYASNMEGISLRFSAPPAPVSCDPNSIVLFRSGRESLILTNDAIYSLQHVARANLDDINSIINVEYKLLGRIRTCGFIPSRTLLWDAYGTSAVFISSDKVTNVVELESNLMHSTPLPSNTKWKAIYVINNKLYCGLSVTKQLIITEFAGKHERLSLRADSVCCLDSCGKRRIIALRSNTMLFFEFHENSIALATKLFLPEFDLVLIGGAILCEDLFLMFLHPETSAVTLTFSNSSFPVWTTTLENTDPRIFLRPIILAQSSFGDIAIRDSSDTLWIISLDVTNGSYIVMHRIESVFPKPLGACFSKLARSCFIMTSQGLFILVRSLDRYGNEIWSQRSGVIDLYLNFSGDSFQKLYVVDSEPRQLFLELDALLLKICLPPVDSGFKDLMPLELPHFSHMLNLLLNNRINEFSAYLDNLKSVFDPTTRNIVTFKRKPAESTNGAHTEIQPETVCSENSSYEDHIFCISELMSITSRIKEAIPSLDSNGTKFCMLAQLPLDTLDGLQFLAAYRSDAQDRIIDLFLANASVDVPLLKRSGFILWSRNKQNLRKIVELAARNEFNRSPMLSSLLYLILGRTSLLRTLMRTIRDEELMKLDRFIGNTPPEADIIIKNAYSALSKRKFHMAIFFFLLANHLYDALLVSYKKLGDLQLAFLIGSLSNDEETHKKALVDYLNAIDGLPICMVLLLSELCQYSRSREKVLDNLSFASISSSQLVCLPLALESLGYVPKWSQEMVMACVRQLTKSMNFDMATSLLNRHLINNDDAEFQAMKTLVLARRSMYFSKEQ